MAWQLIYTSALRTLVPGQSGYGTVARSADLREALIQRLEQLSYYQHLAGLGGSTAVQSHVVSAYRILDFRGSRYHVLSRIQDAGLDFTSRTNHLAHHLVFEPAELAGVAPPAIVLSQWPGWRGGWQEGPRFLEEADWGDFRALPRGVSLPAVAWQAMTGDAGSAAGLLVRPHATGCNLLCQAGEEATLLNLFAESLQLLDPDCRHPVKLWEHTFTTFLQAEDNPSDFIWRGCVEGTPGWQAIQRTADGALVPLRTLAAPANQLAKLAREGRPQIVVQAKPAPIPASPSPVSSPTPLRLESRSPAWRKPPASTPPSTTRSVMPPRAVTLDPTSVRFWVPALLLLLLLAAFVGPRYLKSPVGGKSGSVAPSTNSALADADSGSLLPDLAPPVGSQRDQPKPKPGAEARPPPPPREALDALNQQMDNTATWLVVLDGELPFTFPKSTELDGLLRKHLLNDKPLTEILECRVADGRIDLSGGPAPAVDLESNQTRPKQITAKLSGGARLVLDCDDWFNASRGATGDSGPVRVKWASAPVAGAFTLLLRPVSSSPMLEPFRLVVLTGKPSPSSAPIHLSKTLLRPARDGLEALAPELLARVKAIQSSDARARWQLRPSTANSAEADLIESLDAAARPAPGRELDFAGIRERLGSRLTQDRRKIERVEGEAARLRHQIEDDRPLGEILAGHTNEMASLSSFAKARKRDVDGQVYLAYLKEVLAPIDEKLAQRLPPPDVKPDEARQALTDLGGFLSRHPRLEKKMESVPPGYFVKRWEVLARVPDLKLMETNLEKTRRTISQCEGSLELVPRDLVDAPVVSLVLVATSGRRYELIRFADPKSKPAP